MSNAVQFDKITELLASGNIDQFSPKEKVEYISRICEATGLNPLTRPFDFIRFQGKTVLYANKGCADQLRKINNISISVTEKKIEDGVLFITVEGKDGAGRIDTDLGALPVGNLKGDQLANAVMKCLTKAKRRLTLSMCGLGIMDESEFDTLDNAFEDGKKEMSRIESAETRIEEKRIVAENMDEIQNLSASILSSLTALTHNMDGSEKGKVMFHHLKINSYKDIVKIPLEELKMRDKHLKEIVEEKRLRGELSKPENSEPPKKKNKEQEKPTFNLNNQ